MTVSNQISSLHFLVVITFGALVTVSGPTGIVATTLLMRPRPESSSLAKTSMAMVRSPPGVTLTLCMYWLCIQLTSPFRLRILVERSVMRSTTPLTSRKGSTRMKSPTSNQRSIIMAEPAVMSRRTIPKVAPAITIKKALAPTAAVDRLALGVIICQT